MMKDGKSDAPLGVSHNTARANDLLCGHTDDEASDEGEEQAQLEADEENTTTTEGGIRAARRETR